MKTIRTLSLLLALLLALCLLAPSAHAAPGDLDLSFNGTGKVTTPIGSGGDNGHAVVVQADGKIVVAGEAANGSGFVDFALVRYNADGTLDPSFNGTGKVITAVSSGHDAANGVAVQSDGMIVVAGYAFNGTNNDFAVVRYLGDGFPVVTTLAATGVTTTGATLHASVNPNGLTTTAQFQYGPTTAYGSTATVALSPSDGTSAQAVSAVLSGLTPNTLYHFLLTATNGAGTTNGADQTFTTPAQDIAVEQPAGTGLVDGTASIAFGIVDIGVGSAAKTFTVANTGTANLTLGAITKDGTNPGDFTVNTNGMLTTVPVGGSTTFAVTFNPTASGSRSAAIHIASNVSGAKNPFDIALTGTGTTTVTPTFANAGSMPVTSNGFAATGLSIGALTLGFNPAPGQVLTLVNNTSANPIGGTFTDLPNGGTWLTIYNGRSLLFGASYTGGDGNDLTLTLLNPEIVVEQPAGTDVANGGSKSFGTVNLGSSASRTFTIKNTGAGILNGLTITKSGTDQAAFVVTASPVAPVSGPSGSTTLTVQFTPATSGAKTAVIHIASDDADENPFDITLTGQALSANEDTDGDGLNDAAEFQLASLGYNWQVSQPALVSTLFTNANIAGLFNQTQMDASRQAGRNDVTGAPNTYSLYTLTQVQTLNVGVPLLTKDPGTGKFKLTIGIQKTANLTTTPFAAFPFTAPDTTINAQGNIEFLFTVPGNAAFFRVQTQ